MRQAKIEEVEQTVSCSLEWLDEQPEESVECVSFESRTAQSSDQIRELVEGWSNVGTSSCGW